MHFERIRVVLWNQADKSDPLNQSFVVSAKAHIDGKAVGWTGRAEWEDHRTRTECLQSAVEDMISQILTDPHNWLEEGKPPKRV
jgi:hypothetical protein